MKTNKQTVNEEEIVNVTGGNHTPIYSDGGSIIHAPTAQEPIVEGQISPTSTKAWFNENKQDN